MDLLKYALVPFCLTALAYGDEQCCCPKEMGYNAPACILICDSCCNGFIDVSFNYWQPIQENMEMGILDSGTQTNLSYSGLALSSLSSTDSLQNLNMSFNYKPGFTVGLGTYSNCDNWDIRIGYTWFHNTHKNHTEATRFALFDSATQVILPTWGTLLDSESNAGFQFVREKWKLGMDLFDLDLGRSYYVGCCLTFHPSIGIRSGLISQKVTVSYSNGFADFAVDLPGLLGIGALVEDKNIKAHTYSWGLGPKMALDTQWLLGCGFRLFGKGEVDLLYTRYTRLKEKTVTTGTVVGSINFVPFEFALDDTTRGKQNNVGCLRTHLDLELGLGFGTYFYCSQYYVDWEAGYGFQVFFDQNMFRHNSSNRSHFIPNGNLYIHGLIVKMKVDF